MDAEPHRIWRYAGLAWIGLIAVPTVHAVRLWYLGSGRDSDMSGVHELILMFLMVLSAPMAALAFGVFAPLAIVIDRIADGRTSRFVNILIGAALAAPALFVTVVVVGPQHDWMGVLAVVRHPDRAIGLFAALPLAGMIVGLGLRHRRSTAPTVSQQTDNGHATTCDVCRCFPMDEDIVTGRNVGQGSWRGI